MKIRIRANSIRFRLTKPEVEELCLNGSVREQAEFANSSFQYEVTRASIDELSAAFEESTIRLSVPEALLDEWHTNEQVGFEHYMDLPKGGSLHLLLEKDFTCLTDRGEDERDNYENPKAIK